MDGAGAGAGVGAVACALQDTTGGPDAYRLFRIRAPHERGGHELLAWRRDASIWKREEFAVQGVSRRSRLALVLHSVMPPDFHLIVLFAPLYC